MLMRLIKKVYDLRGHLEDKEKVVLKDNARWSERFYSYGIVYDSWPCDTDDCLIKVTSWPVWL